MSTHLQRLEQERECFQVNRAHAERWFTLRLIMAYCSIALTIGLALGLGFVLGNVVLHPDRFPTSLATAATGGLLVNAFGAPFAIWRLVLGQSVTPLVPVTAPAASPEKALVAQMADAADQPEPIVAQATKSPSDRAAA